MLGIQGVIWASGYGNFDNKHAIEAGFGDASDASLIGTEIQLYAGDTAPEGWSPLDHIWGYCNGVEMELWPGDKAPKGFVLKDNMRGIAPKEQGAVDNTDYSSSNAKQNYDNEHMIFENEVSGNISMVIDDVDEAGKLPGETFTMKLSYPVVYGNVQGTRNGNVTTYVGDYGSISIENGTITKMPNDEFDVIHTDSNGNKTMTAIYEIEVNTGDLSSNVVKIDVYKDYYNYTAKFNVYYCVNDTVCQPVGEIPPDGIPKRGDKLGTAEAHNSVPITCKVAIEKYVQSISANSEDAVEERHSVYYHEVGHPDYVEGELKQVTNLADRKENFRAQYNAACADLRANHSPWNGMSDAEFKEYERLGREWKVIKDFKPLHPAIGEIGDRIVYTITVTNDTEANLYVDVTENVPDEIELDPNTSLQWTALEVKAKSSIDISISGVIKKAAYYEAPAINTVTLNDVSATGADEHSMRNILGEEWQKDQDAFICKQYKVHVNTFINNVTRADGETKIRTATNDLNEKLVDIENGAGQDNTDGYFGAYYPSGNNREPITTPDDPEAPYHDLGIEDTKKAYPIYVEKGDLVTYRVNVRNNSNGLEPCYAPDAVTALINYELPEQTTLKDIKFVGLEYNGEEHTDGVADEGFIDDGRNESEIVGLANGIEIRYEVTVQVNLDADETKIDLREFSAKVTKITNRNGVESNLPSDYDNPYTDANKLINGNINNLDQKQISRDWIVLKQYKVHINTFITDIEHATMPCEENETFAQDENSFVIHKDKNEGEYRRTGTGDEYTDVPIEDFRFNNPGYAERGDYVTYKLNIKNDGNTDTLCHYPGKVKVQVDYSLHDDLKDVIDIWQNTDETVSEEASFKWNRDNETILIENLRNGEHIDLFVKVKVNENADEMNTKKREFRATITTIWNCNNAEMKLDEKTNDEPIKTRTANNGKKITTADWIVLKQYKVHINTFISQVNREDGRDPEEGERLVDTGDEAYNPGEGRKRDENQYRDTEIEKIRRENPVCAEVGDFVTFTLNIRNEGDENESCYYPGKMQVDVDYVLPEGTSFTDWQDFKIREVRKDSDEIKASWDDKGNLLVTNLRSGEEISFEVKVHVDDKIYDRLRTFTATITEIKNCNDIVVTNNEEKQTTADHLRIKEYNIALDYYIKKAEHEEKLEPIVTFGESDKREAFIDAEDIEKNREANPVWVEYGDIVTYTFKIYNTTSNHERYEINGADAPYREPQYVYTDIEIELPQKYSQLQPLLNEGETWDMKDGKLICKDVKIPRGEVRTFDIKLIVEEVESYEKSKKKEVSTAKLISVKNINRKEVNYDKEGADKKDEIINHAKRVSSSDWYVLNDYCVEVQQYVSQYNAEMAIYNNIHGFTKDDDEGFTDELRDFSEEPLDLEKYETFVFATQITNKSTGEESEDYTEHYGKYPTRVRTTRIHQTISQGLEYIESGIKWYDENGNVKQDVPFKLSDSAEDMKIKYTYDIENNEILLSPGESIVYYIKLKVKESNMTLEKLESTSEMDILTNVNRNIEKTAVKPYAPKNLEPKEHTRIVTEQNIAEKTEDTDYVQLKDLIIAGHVWLDQNRNGYIDGENGKSGVTVKLYTEDGASIDTQITDENGFYSFGRQDKTKRYYVEFEYDGVTYKATEVYGGVNTGNADGTANLEKEGGREQWRQGYEDLPDVTSGATEYMADSNAYEFDDVRNAHDELFKTIGFNKAYDEGTDLDYSKNAHISEFNGSSSQKVKARSFITQNHSAQINESDENTKMLFLYDYEGYSSEFPETEYLKFINLGLTEREKIDISLDADVHSVKTTINGEEMTYDYNQNDADSSAENYDAQTNSYKLNQAYDLDLYATDYGYRYNNYYEDDSEVETFKNIGSELNTEVTYRVRIINNRLNGEEPNMANQDIEVDTAINELAIYYDKCFMDANNDTQVTTKEKNAVTGILQAQSQQATRVRYGTEAELNGGGGTALTVNQNSKYGNNVPSDIASKDYKVMYVTGMDDKYLAEGEERYVDITLTVDKNSDRALKLTKDEDMGLELISEIAAYTTKYSENTSHAGLRGRYAGLIDKDSNPGNLGLNGCEDYGNYEDDTYKVGIKVGLIVEPDEPRKPEDPEEPEDPEMPETKIERKITGKVWDDARSKTLGDASTDIQYLGNGTYNVNDTNDPKAATNPDTRELYNQDKLISGVKVSLIEIVQMQDSEGKMRYYEYPARYTYDIRNEKGELIHEKGDKIETRTDENGEYTLSNFIPGYYKIKFDYGDKDVLYNGQDYKSTTYYNKAYYNETFSDNVGSSNNHFYFDGVKTSLSEANQSDAQDDEIRRLNVNSYSETMTAAQAYVFSSKQIKENQEKLMKNTWMCAESTIFYTKPEEVASSVTHISPPADFNNTRLWNIHDLDFGIEYRPEASIVLDKEISSMELVTTNGEPLIKLYFDKDAAGNRVINEQKSTGYQNVQFLPNQGKEQQGFVYINMDTEILEGCTIKVEYDMTSNNDSEVDRINQNLEEIKFESGATAKGYTSKVYVSNNYSANGTAANTLQQEYCVGYNFDTAKGKETFQYLKKLKKSYEANTKENEYYGRYLGQTYYTGAMGAKDVVSQLKVDQILDYIDNDFTFSQSENNGKNRLWKTTTSPELKQSLIWSKVNHEDYHLIDKFGIRYDTENKSNLALSVDDNKTGNANTNRNGNVSLSRFLKTKQETSDSAQYSGKISALATKVMSAKDITEGTGLSYENISEVIQYTILTGRRTKLPDGRGNGGVIGNANTSKNWNGYDPLNPKSEDDTDATEIITISPPTGLTK